MNILALKIKPWLFAGMALLVPLFSLLFSVLSTSGDLMFLSEKDLVAAYRMQQPGAGRPLYYLNYLPASATYYSHGQAGILTGASTGLPRNGFWLAVHKTEGNASTWQCSVFFKPKRGLFDLYLCQ